MPQLPTLHTLKIFNLALGTVTLHLHSGSRAGRHGSPRAAGVQLKREGLHGSVQPPTWYIKSFNENCAVYRVFATSTSS